MAVTKKWFLPSDSRAYHLREKLKELGCRFDSASRRWYALSEEMHAAALILLPERGSIIDEWSFTVHTDAGFRDGIGRMAWFCRSSFTPYKVTGAESRTVPNSTYAEELAMLLGLQRAVDLWPFPKTGTGTIYLRSDCMSVVRQLNGQTRTLSSPMKEARDMIPSHIKVNAKHVAGHGRDANQRAAFCNRAVDQLSHLRGEQGKKRVARAQKQQVVAEVNSEEKEDKLE